MEEIEKRGIFKRTLAAFRRSEVKTFVFFLSILILSWPFMTNSTGWSSRFPFVYFFSTWMALIVFLFVSHLPRDKKED